MNKRIAQLLVLMSYPILSCSAYGSKCPETAAAKLVQKMKCGWNLGNTLDANPLADNPFGDRAGCTVETETSWGMPVTTEEMIKTIADSGIKTIRIPVSWTDHIIAPEKDYTVDPAWMARVKQITDWALKYDMYVIINIHHDTFPNASGLKAGYGYYPSYSYETVSLDYVGNIWKQIAETFKDYDEHLVFETLNEPRLRGHEHEWNYSDECTSCRSAMKEINKLNQKAVDTIRASGGNNITRLIMVPSYGASPYAALTSRFVMPDDKSCMLALSVHMYTPFVFAMQDDAKGGTPVFTDAHKKELDSIFSQLESKFSDNGYPVIIGEYGATNKNNLKDRTAWFTYFVHESTSGGMIPILWDNNAPVNSNPQEAFGFFDRKNLSWYFPEILDAIVSAVPAK